MKILIGIPHVFSPKEGSLYSSESESKRGQKQKALIQAANGNLYRHQKENWIHASLGLHQPVITRAMETEMGAEIQIQIYTDKNKTLTSGLPHDERIKIIHIDLDDPKQIPLATSRRLIEQADAYDMICYLEDDLLIEDNELFRKIEYLVNGSGGKLTFIPHRCEQISGRGDVILSGDPDGGRPDLFWDTGETITVPWPLGEKKFYRATNPHSGCYFLTRQQAIDLRNYWSEKKWIADFTLSGPLEQAASGLLLPVFKIMKPRPEHYRFLMIRHQDCLWQRHSLEKIEDSKKL